MVRPSTASQKANPKPKSQWVYVNYHGCEKRKLDAQRVLNFFKANNFRYTQDPRRADFVVYMTCAFSKIHEELSLKKLIKIYDRKAPHAQFIVSGCLPSINPKAVARFPDTIFIGPRELDKFDQLIAPEVHFNQIPDPNTTIFEGHRMDSTDYYAAAGEARREYDWAKQGFKIRINEGCLGNCAYCVTRLATRELQSKPLELILREFRSGLDEEVNSFFFTGGDSGAYGIDLGITIVHLLREVVNIPKTFKIHFHDFGVQWLINHLDDLILIFQSYPEKLGCFNFPVQSGSDKILKLMRRPYTAAAVLRALQTLKQKVPAIKIGTHFIAGFPGETEEDFQLSVEFVKKAPLDFFMTFPYADHELADSYGYQNKIPESVVKSRYRTLLKVFEDRNLSQNNQ